MPDLICYSSDKDALIAEARQKIPHWVNADGDLAGNHTPLVEVQGQKTQIMSLVRIRDMDLFGSFTTITALGEYVDGYFVPFSEVAQAIYDRMYANLQPVTVTLPDGSTGASAVSNEIGAIL